MTRIAWAFAVGLLLGTECVAQTSAELPDKRLVFDATVKDQARIISIINRIEAEERAIEARANDLTKSQTELQNVIAQTQAVALPQTQAIARPRPNSASARAALSEIDRASDEAGKLKILRESSTQFSDLATSVRDRDAAFVGLRQIFSATASRVRADPNLNEVSTKITQRLSTLGPGRCSGLPLSQALEIAKGTSEKVDYGRYVFGGIDDVVSLVQSCIEFAGRTVDLADVRNQILTELKALDTELKSRKDQLLGLMTALGEAKAKWQAQLQRSGDISSTLIEITIPILGVLIILMLAVPALYTKEVQIQVIANGIILEVFTVFLLIASVLLLGIAGRIPVDSLGTLLGGISGYVLGRSATRAAAKDAENNQSTTTTTPTVPPPPAAAPVTP